MELLLWAMERSNLMIKLRGNARNTGSSETHGELTGEKVGSSDCAWTM